MSELPKGWVELSLNVLGMPSTPNIDPSKFPNEIFELYSVPAYANKEPDIVPGSSIHSVKQLVQPGDVLLCKIVPHLNRVRIVQESGQHRQIASGEWIVIRSEIVDSDYLRYELTEPVFRSAFMQTVSGVGGSLMRARTKAVAEIQLATAPLNEQRRIVAKLDRLFARSRCAREELGRVSGLVQRYKQAVLAAAFRGDLTADWREKSGKLRTEWRNLSLDNLISCSQNGLSKRYGSDGQEIVVLRLADIKDYKVCLSEPRKIKLTKQEKDKYILQIGDILVVRVNGSKDIVGRLVLITEELNAGYCDYFIRLSLNSECNPEWLSYHGNSERFRKYISENIVSSAGQNTVSQGTLKDYVLEVPCLEEQKQIVQRVEKLFKAINFMEQEHQKASKLLDRLEQATLSKAFRGELVTQDPNDEPAAVLLKRIQSDRQAQPKRKAIKSKQSHH